MTVDSVRQKLSNHIGDKVVIKYNLGRNKYEKYEVIIKELYNYVFLVELENEESNEIKSFSYSDVITKTIRIEFSNLWDYNYLT